MAGTALAAGAAVRGPSRPFVATVAFLTLVDLFAAQAIIPALTVAYGVSPGEMGVAVNASTFGMAAASLGVALFAGGLDRRRAVAVALALLSVPTALLAVAPDLGSFAALRVAQGLCMATAFSLTLAALGELLKGATASAAFAAYVTGNVAANLFGRLAATGAVEAVGLPGTFVLFALFNLAGAVLVWRSGHHAPGMMAGHGLGERLVALRGHLSRRELCAAFGLGFCILFAFIGLFTYVNFALTRPPIGLGAMDLGLVYLVFLPSLVTTPLAGPAAARLGAGVAALIGLGVAGLGLIGLASGALWPMLAGMAAAGAGTFFAQAAATGFVSRSVSSARASASGLYLASYFAGGFAGAALLGWVFEAHGWSGCLAGIAVALSVGAALALPMREPRSVSPCPRS